MVLSPSQHVWEDDAHPIRATDVPLTTRRIIARLHAEGSASQAPSPLNTVTSQHDWKANLPDRYMQQMHL